jgi:hypothetical protein
VADTTAWFSPFYSTRTLEDVHMLVQELDDAMAVYVMMGRTPGMISGQKTSSPKFQFTGCRMLLTMKALFITSGELHE